MGNKIGCIIISCLFLWSCTETSSVNTFTNLQELINSKIGLDKGEVIACAASDKLNDNKTYIFYYPIPSAKNIQYFETESVNVNKDDYSLYKLVELEKEGVFNGYLERFVRESIKEVWCIVTYEVSGKFYRSNPIRLKHQSIPTEWTSNVIVDKSVSLKPKFTWADGLVKENVIYFQVITDFENNLLSGTYTYDKWFQYYTLSNVVLNITRESPPDLIKGNDYGFTMMGVSEDNWVNLVLQKTIKVE